MFIATGSITRTFCRKPTVIVLGLAVLLLAGINAAHADVCRVTASGTGSGATWSSPMDLQTALKTLDCGEIWVAAGTYRPTTPDGDIKLSFNVRPDVAVYGGFAGTESQRRERDPVANRTTLSGDLNADDRANFTHYTDNSQHVVTMDGTQGSPITAETVLDGFTIRGGHANQPPKPHYFGGGLYCNGSGSGNECSPTLENITFEANFAIYGGGMYNNGNSGGTSSPTLRNVTFNDNVGAGAGGSGGGMNNDGMYGGDSSPSLTSVTFSNNNASGLGGAMNNQGDYNGTSSPTLTNVTFYHNGANAGGAMANSGDHAGTSNPTLRNVTFSGNHAGAVGNAMANFSESDGTNNPILRNVLMWNGTHPIKNFDALPTISDSIIEGGCISGDGNICTNVSTTDPKLGALADNGGYTQTLLPGIGSSAIDTGNDTTCKSQAVNNVDQRGVQRPQGAHCDIGAVEVAVVTTTASSGSGQQTDVWASFVSPMVVQVRDAANQPVRNVRLQALPAAAGLAGARCSAGTTDSTGVALLYCQANGVPGGPYALKVRAFDAPTSAPAIFLLTNTPGDGDLIFRDGFDPPGPRTSIMAAGDAPVDFALTMPGDLPDGVSMPLRALSDTQHRRRVLVEARKQGGAMWLRITRYRDHGRHGVPGKWWPASAHPQLHMNVSASGTQAHVH